MDRYTPLKSMGKYESNIRVDPRKKDDQKECVGRCAWGPVVWDSLMIFATTYTPEKKSAILAYLNSLKHLLPCDFCRTHFEENITKILPITDSDLKSNETLMAYIYRLHDLVNKQINAYNLAHGIHAEPKKSPPYPEVRDYWIRKLL